ncbi:TrkA C-terminal domain-containing protein [uncultured Shimia sp.]|uniref:aspartate:alanine exchanger family transporter n=1 Tax=uncultured Shimia sp. TaxID=573152 RepID=UPI0025D6AD99|nr:TrkA C-terminal domain-containing protein [uncultured Shimia sp.]
MSRPFTFSPFQGLAVLLSVILTPGFVFAQSNDATAPEGAIGNVFSFFEPIAETGLHGFFVLLGDQPIVFLLLSLAIGYPLGRLSFAGISLGSTAGVLIAAVALSMIAQSGFGLTYSIPSILSSVFLLFFMYALGLKVGPQFFSGLRSGALAFLVISFVVWGLNWLICVVGADLAGLDPGYAAGLISGSYTITAVMGVAQSAIDSGAYQVPADMTAEQVGANIAAGYAISYILSSIGIILVIRYLPQMMGHDPAADARTAEIEFSGGDETALPGTADALVLGFSPYDLRAYRVEHAEFVGQTIGDLAQRHREAPVLRVMRDNAALDMSDSLRLAEGDIVTVRGDVHELILEGTGMIGPEVADAAAREVPLEAADIRVGSHEVSGKTLAEIAQKGGYGVQLSALFRGGQAIPIGPNTDVRFGDVLRLTGPDVAIQKAAKALGGRPILDSTVTEVTYMAIAMAIGYLVGILSVTVAGIPIALGTSAGCLLMGIFVSYFRSRNPSLGGPVSEGARSFLQDIGLNMFVAVLGANVGPKVISALGGDTVIWLALIGTAAALVPVVVAFFIADKVFRLNSVINDGACTGARNSTPGLNAIVDQSGSTIAAVAFPLTYAITTVLALFGGYIAMVIS